MTRPEEIFWIAEKWLEKKAQKVPFMICHAFTTRKDKADFIRALRRLQVKRAEDGSLRIREFFPADNLLGPRCGHEFYAHIGCDKENRQNCNSRKFAACVVTGLYRGYLQEG